MIESIEIFKSNFQFLFLNYSIVSTGTNKPQNLFFQ